MSPTLKITRNCKHVDAGLQRILFSIFSALSGELQEPLDIFSSSIWKKNAPPKCKFRHNGMHV
jgi:hypothetical protein